MKDVEDSAYWTRFMWKKRHVTAVLMSLFSALEHAVNFMRQRNYPPYFTDIARNVEVATGYPLTLSRFRQLWNIMPRNYFVRWKSGELQVSLYEFGTEIGQLPAAKMLNRLEVFETMLSLNPAVSHFKSSLGLQGILPDLELTMHELPERPVASKGTVSSEQTEFERRLAEIVPKTIVCNYHLTKAVINADVALQNPTDVIKFNRAILLGKMHARKAHFVPTQHWIWNDKYLEEFEYIVRRVNDIEDVYYVPQVAASLSQWSKQKVAFDRHYFAALLIAVHERNSNLISQPSLQLLLDRVLTTKQKPSTSLDDVRLMSEALHLIDDVDGNHAALKPYLDNIAQLFELNFLLDFDVVGPTRKECTSASLEEQKDEKSVEELKDKKPKEDLKDTNTVEVLKEASSKDNETLTEVTEVQL